MGKERFKRDSRDSFHGRFLHEKVVPNDHFLVKLKGLISRQRFTYRLVKCYKGKAKEGGPRGDLGVTLKMLLVSYLNDISERQTEEMANLNLAAEYFLGLGVNQYVPDHSTLTAFKDYILENGKLVAHEMLPKRITNIALAKRIKLGSTQVPALARRRPGIDSVRTVADVHVEKVEKKWRDGRHSQGW